MRRGGYGDAGGVASSGELPRAEPVAVQSEEQLRAEVEVVAASLRAGADWEKRVEALLRLEGLTLGGAAEYEGFVDCLLAARDPLISQVLERRSAVSRQACHAVSVLAEACGDRMEALAVQLLPVLLKAIAMGIQVVTDSADACARSLVRYCHAPKVLPRLCSTLTGDKNGKLRQYASGYLLQVLEKWDPALLERHLDTIELAILAAAQDAQSETRAAGRLMYAIYGSAWPQQASTMLQRIERDRPLQEKLLQALEAYQPSIQATDSSSSQPLSRRSSFGHSGTQPSTPRGGARSQGLGPASTTAVPSLAARPAGRPPALVPRLALSSLTGSSSSSPTSSSMPSLPNSARLPATLAAGITPRAVRQPPATARAPRVGSLQEGENLRPNGGGSGASTPRGLQSKPASGGGGMDPGTRAQHMGRLGSRKSMGGAALRINIAAMVQEQAGEEGSSEDSVPFAVPTASQPGSLSARRVAAPLSARARRQSALPQGAQAFYSRPDSARRVEAEQSSIAEGSDNNSEIAACCSSDDRPPAAALGQLLGQLSKAGTSWVDKVQAFGALGEALQGAGSSPQADVAANADRVAACLLEGIGDAHFKVATAALEALREGLAGRNSKLFEPLLDRLMPALFLRTVDPKEQIKQLAGGALAEIPKHHSPDLVLAALAKSLQQSRAPKVKVAVLEFFAGAATGLVELEDGLDLAPGPALRTLVGLLLQLAVDKSPDIRRAAARAVAVVYHAEQGAAVVVGVQALPPAQALAVQRALAAAVPSLEVDLAAAMRASRPAPVAGAGSAAAPTASSSRRHSGEGLLLQLPPALLNVSTSRGASKPAAGAAAAVAPPKPATAPAATSAGPRLQPKSAALHSPRSGSPGRRIGGDASPAGPSPSMSRLGRQASNASACSSAADMGIAEQQLARQPSNYVAHTSSPTASQPALWRTASLPSSGAAAASPQVPSPLGRTASAAAVGAEREGGPQAAAPPGSISELAPFDDIMEGQLRRLLAQLVGGPSPEVFQGLCRLAHVLPGSAWTSHLSQVLPAVLAALGSSSPLLRESGLALVGDLAAVQPGLFAGPLPALLPQLLQCAADPSREVVVAADEVLSQLLGGLPALPSLALLVPRLPQRGAALTADPEAGSLLYATLKSLRRVATRLPAAEAQGALLPDLVPGLCTAYCSPIADVRKATVDCLVSLWLVVGDALLPHLSELSASQMKLLAIYRDKALGQQ